MLNGALAVPALLGSYAAWRAQRELQGNGQLSSSTALAAYLAYAAHAAVVGLAALRSTWTLPVPRRPARLVGALLATLGGGLYGVGTVRLGSIKRMSGRRTDKLVTGGIFRHTRNPQYLGWGLLLLGVSVVGRSGYAVLSTGLYACAVRALVVRLEEPHLQDAFAEPYERYQAETARWLGHRGKR
jgi:protein-S-isoprenylcysteine O-methyltransferase Ste14